MGHQQRRYARTRHLALILAVLAVLAGCASGRPARPAERTRSAVTPALAVSQAVLATNASSLREKWYRNRAEQQLTAQCMNRLGFAYQIPDMGSAPGLNILTAFALGNGSPATYGVRPDPVVTAPPGDPDADQPGYQLALGGPLGAMRTVTLPGGAIVGYQTGGCQADARRELYGSVEAFMVAVNLPQLEGIRFAEFLTSDRAYLSALRTWQACMRAGKFPVRSPDDAARSLLQLSGQARAAALIRRQAAMAAADASCDGPSHLRQRTNLALGQFVGSLSPQVLTQLNDVARTQASADRMARQLASR